MSEQNRLGAAIRTISEKYLPNVLKANDGPGILKWSLRLADYATRLAALVAPPLTQAETADTVPAEALSSDPSVALLQILKATGHPITFDASGATIGLVASAVIGDATAEQIRELALLGFFGQPGLIAGVDYSLFEQYYESTGGDNWAPKGPYLNTGTWAAYVASKA